MQVQLMSHVPSMPSHVSFAQVLQEVLDMSAMAVVERSWSHWPLCHVVVEASTE